MNRAERRRNAKLGMPVAVQPRLVASGYVDHATGKKYADVNDYLDDMEKTMASQAARIAADIMYHCENYICFANIIIMLIAMKMAVGNLKTVQKSYQKIIDNYNVASEYVDKIGIREAYNELKRDYDIDMEFDDFDINLPFEDEEHYKQLHFKLHEREGIQKNDT